MAKWNQVMGRTGWPRVSIPKGLATESCPVREQGGSKYVTCWPAASLQREVLPSTRLGTLPPAFSTRVLPAQATEYAFAFIQVPQDVSLESSSFQRVLSTDTQPLLQPSWANRRRWKL